MVDSLWYYWSSASDTEETVMKLSRSRPAPSSVVMSYCYGDETFAKMMGCEDKIARFETYQSDSSNSHLLHLYFKNDTGLSLLADHLSEENNRHLAIQENQLWVIRWNETSERGRLSLRRRLIRSSYYYTIPALIFNLIVNFASGFTFERFLSNLSVFAVSLAVSIAYAFYLTREKKCVK